MDNGKISLQASLEELGPLILGKTQTLEAQPFVNHHRSEYNWRVHYLIPTKSIFVNQYIAHGLWAKSSIHQKLWLHSPPPPASH